MQIAKIVPKVRTAKGGVFDYSIPPDILPQIKIGVLVQVPFHGRKLEGIVIDLKAKTQVKNLKTIIKIIDPYPVVDSSHIKLATWMSNYYFTSLGQTLFENIVPPAVRKICKDTQDIKIQSHKNNPKNSSKILLIQNDFANRLRIYQKYINDAIARKKSIIILVPDLTLIKYFIFLKNAIRIDAKMTLTQRWTSWNKIRISSQSIIVGSQSALFAPANNLGLVIIDQVENETYKNDRAPRYLSSKVAEELGKITGAQIIYGSLTPPIELLHQFKNYRLPKYEVKTLPKNTIIVDMNFEKNIISFPLQRLTDKVFLKKQKALFVINRKGEGYLKCFDCGWTSQCPNCNLPLRPLGEYGLCYHCDKQYQLQKICPKCGNAELKYSGLGTKKIARICQKIWPERKILVLEKDVSTSVEKYNIIVATSFALKFPLSNIGLTAIIDTDLEMNLPSGF